MRRFPVLIRPESRAPVLALIVLSVLTPVVGEAQTAEPLSWQGKLEFHAKTATTPLAIVGLAAYAGVLHKLDTPREWGQGASGYGKRFGSTAAASGIHAVLAFGLDTTLHQDPRYYRSVDHGFWRRAGHAIRGTVLTRTDSGGETLSTWRFGSDYGSAFISNMWYPDRLNTVRLGLLQGSLSLGLDMAVNLGTEFLPDVKKVFHRRTK